MPNTPPVNILTGFLGAGKTTLLQRLLKTEAYGVTAVLVNEFGEIGLDQHLVSEIAPDVVLLDSGCLCCSVRGELRDALLDLHTRRERGELPAFRQAVIETTGLAEPGPILGTVLGDPVVNKHYRLGHVITLVDAVNGGRQLDRRDESLTQAAVADRLVVSKTDLVKPGKLDRLRQRLRALNPNAELFDAAENVGATLLFAPRSNKKNQRLSNARRWLDSVDHDHTPHAKAKTTSFALRFEQPLNWTAFGVWLSLLLSQHGNNILRVKGLLNVGPDRPPVLLNGVQHLVYPPQHLDGWPKNDPDRRSRIVFIVRGLEKTRIEHSLNAFLAAA